MEENNEEYLFSPKCFEKDLKKIFKYIKNDRKQKILYKGKGQNRIFEINNKNSFAYLTSIYSDLSPGLILEKLKEFNHLKMWFPYVDDINSLMWISHYCDILEIEFSLPILNLFNIKNQFQIIRYWSYDPIEHYYYLMFKTFNHKKFFDNIENGGFIIKVNPNVTNKSESGCHLTFFIKIRKSKYTSLIDNIYKYFCKEFCSSLENFIGSVKLHKHNLILNENLNYEKNNQSESVDSYKYLIHYFTNVNINENSSIKNENSNLFKKMTEIDTNDLKMMKAYFEVKNYISYNYNEKIFNENEIIRYIVGFKGDISKILIHLEELNNFKKNVKLNLEDFEDLPIDLNEFIFILGEDKFKRPVIIIRLNFLNLIITNDYKISDLKLIHFFIFVFNKAIESMCSIVDKYVMILDSKNLNINEKEIPFEMLKKLFNIFYKFYPERLGEIYFINKSIFFNNLWKNIFHLIEKINPEIIDKIKIKNNYMEELSDILDKEKLDLL